jgi:acyl carrier protein
MENRQIYVLDRRGQPVPIGVAGEIYIGGAGVARGYLNRPEQNAERFHRDPFNADPNARIYRTGDSARWRVDGTLEYLGRNDRQVKIRGHRIELGEIETQLMRHAQVREAVVLVREDTPGEKRLVGYVVEQASNSNGVGGRKVESAPAAEHLRSYLKARLPEYMVPVALVALEKLPLTVNGKLDWRALPAPDREAYAQGQYEPPLGEMENFVAGLWQQILGASQVGRHDDFFDLGGHSLLAMQVAVRIRAALSIAIPVTWLFQFPTVQQFSARVDEVRQGRLLRKLEEGGHEIEELLARVSSMSEGAVRKLVQELAAGGSQ